MYLALQDVLAAHEVQLDVAEAAAYLTHQGSQPFLGKGLCLDMRAYLISQEPAAILVSERDVPELVRRLRLHRQIANRPV